MQIVIEIPKNVYEAIKEYEDIFRRHPKHETMCAIADGVPLPEGHGRLIDVDELLDYIGLDDTEYNREVNAGEIITLEDIDRMTTIVEADREV